MHLRRGYCNRTACEKGTIASHRAAHVLDLTAPSNDPGWCLPYCLTLASFWGQRKVRPIPVAFCLAQRASGAKLELIDQSECYVVGKSAVLLLLLPINQQGHDENSNSATVNR